MAKKQSKAVKTAVAPKVVVEVKTEVAAEKVLTKRNRVPTGVVLELAKAPKDRAEHNKAAWAIVQAALPATAAVLVAALETAVKAETVPAKIVPSAYLSYMIRRGAVAPKA